MDVFAALAICGGAARRPALARLGIDDAALLFALPTADPGHVALAALADVLLHALRCLPIRESLVMGECAVGQHGEWSGGGL
jgi:hypothetical protein